MFAHYTYTFTYIMNQITLRKNIYQEYNSPIKGEAYSCLVFATAIEKKNPIEIISIVVGFVFH